MMTSSPGVGVTALLQSCVVLSALLLAGTANAQTASAAGSRNGSDGNQNGKDDGDRLGQESDIVVTGTLIRSIRPAGSSIIEVPRASIEASGASTTAQVLQTIPQLVSFNALQYPSGASNVATTNRPNLRSLPSMNTSGGSPTLVLLDGHRIVGMGTLSTSPDPDIVPPGMIERVEVLPDGGSATYGSDAIAGVINFVTRKTFRGLELDARQGFGADYRTFDANATLGKNWDSGSAFISYNYSRHGALFGRDRDFVRQFPASLAGVPFGVTGIRCSPGNVQLAANGTIFALPFASGAGVAGTANQCDESDGNTIYPGEHRHSVFAGVTRELGDSAKLELRGYFMSRKMFQSQGEFRSSLFLGPAFIGPFPTGLTTDSPFRQAHLASGNPNEVQQVSFAWGSGTANNTRLSLRSWGLAPSLTANLGGGWQLRALANYGESVTEAHIHNFGAATLANATQAGLFNPYEPGKSEARALAALDNEERFGKSQQRLFNARLVADGDLATLPGGALKLAAGAEYLREQLITQNGQAVPGFQDSGFAGLALPANLPGNPLTVIQPAFARLPVVDLSRNVGAVFGELVLPLFGKANSRFALKELTLSASGRYDDYSDVGGTFNPRLGITWRPLDWIKLRASWGKSFVAPSLADHPKADVTSLTWVSGGNLALVTPPASFVADGTWPALAPGQTSAAILLGNAPGTQPQKATTWSAGIDIEPPVVPGLKLGVSYWNIDLHNIIESPLAVLVNARNVFWGLMKPLIAVNPAQGQIDAALGISDTTVNAACTPQPRCVYAILDIRKRNLGTYKFDGLDFAASYTRATGFGAIDLDINAAYRLGFKISPLDSVPFQNFTASNSSRFKLRASAGAQIGRLRASVALNHTAGYSLDPPVGIAPQQERVGAYDVFNLFLKYDFAGQGAMQDLSLTVNVDNLFDQDPPEFRQSTIGLVNGGFTNGSTLGRLVQLGIHKAF